jgi:tetratricopeptide (TPR) repeat protein
MDEVPYFVWEEILMHVKPIRALGRLSRVSKFFNEICYDDYLQVRYWRENENVWDVLRYKRLEESWCQFCARTIEEKEKVLSKVEEMTERIEASKGNENNDQTRGMCSLWLSQRGLCYLTNLRDFDAALNDFKEASEMFSDEGMPSALNNMAVAYLYLGNLHGDAHYFKLAEEKLLEGKQVNASSVSGGNMCVTLIKQGRFEEALKVAHQATKIAREENMRNANAFHHSKSLSSSAFPLTK